MIDQVNTGLKPGLRVRAGVRAETMPWEWLTNVAARPGRQKLRPWLIIIKQANGRRAYVQLDASSSTEAAAMVAPLARGGRVSVRQALVVKPAASSAHNMDRRPGP